MNACKTASFPCRTGWSGCAPGMVMMILLLPSAFPPCNCPAHAAKTCSVGRGGGGGGGHHRAPRNSHFFLSPLLPLVLSFLLLFLSRSTWPESLKIVFFIFLRERNRMRRKQVRGQIIRASNVFCKDSQFLQLREDFSSVCRKLATG